MSSAWRTVLMCATQVSIANPSSSEQPGLPASGLRPGVKVGEYVEAVWTLAQRPGAMLMVEQKCDFSHIVGIPDQFGTSDAVIIIGDELQIHDLKYGYERVEAFENPQLMLYALGALAQVSLLTDINRVRMFIHQPRINHVSEYECSVQNLEEFGLNVKAIATEVLKLVEHAGGKTLMPFQPLHTALVIKPADGVSGGENVRRRRSMCLLH